MNKISIKAGVKVFLTFLLFVVIAGIFIFNKQQNQIKEKFENQLSLPATLISNGSLEIESIEDNKVIDKLVEFDLMESFVLGTDNKIYYSIKASQVGQSLNNDRNFNVYGDLVKGLSETKSITYRNNGEKYIINATPILSNNLNIIGYHVAKVNYKYLRIIGLKGITFILILLISAVLVASVLVYLFFDRHITSRLFSVSAIMNKLKDGKIDTNFEGSKAADEIGDIENDLLLLTENLSKKAEFASEIEKGNFSYEYKADSKDDVLSNALIDMRDSLKHAFDEDEKRKIQDFKRNWTSQGIAKFSDILRQHIKDIGELSYSIISNLVKYVEANQASLFLVNSEDKKKKFLELTATYAYSRKKYKTKKIEFGDGLIGAVAIEKQTNYLSEIPENYIEISSGLGKAEPRYLLIVPIMHEEELFGIIEIASFNKFEKYQIEFIETLGESIATTLYNAKVNETTAKLLDTSREQAEQMTTQEEEMRQNMEELIATQEEMTRKQNDSFEKIRTLEKELEARNKELSKYRSVKK